MIKVNDRNELIHYKGINGRRVSRVSSQVKSLLPVAGPDRTLPTVKEENSTCSRSYLCRLVQRVEVA
jgi:hypothetical protein